MIRFYSHPAPNLVKISLFLEETGTPHEIIPLDTSRGEQHGAAFRAINPNGKVPAIIDTDGPGGREVRVVGRDHSFKSGLDDETRRALSSSNYPPAA